MIEDLQDEFSQLTQGKKKEPTQKKAMLLFVIVFFVIYATVIILMSKNKISKVLKETNAVEIISNIDKYREIAESRPAVLYFVHPDEGSATTSMVEFERMVKMTGASEYHDVIEGLLEGPDDNSLQTGAVSFIQKGTKLIGLTVSNGIAYINLSEEFANSGSIWGPYGMEIAKAQILKTLQKVDESVTDIVILIDGILLT